MARMLRVLAGLAIATLIGAAFVVGGVQTSPSSASAADSYLAGDLMADAQFFDFTSMTATDVQGFIESKELFCVSDSVQTCLADYLTPTGLDRPSPGPGSCADFHSFAGESGSQVIYDVAQACQISPRVLLALIEMKHHVVSQPAADATFDQAVGYGCSPSGTCDPAYAGFANQVYSTALQFRENTANPNDPSYAFHIGSETIPYSADPACGASQIDILNQATANLYNYMHYQPDAVARSYLAAPAGGDSCSSFELINFYLTYYNWFGSPTQQLQHGSLDTAVEAPGGIRITGWWLDLRTFNPSPYIWVNIDGIGGPHIADGPIGAVGFDFSLNFPGVGLDHGFDITIPSPPGMHQVCVYGSRANMPLIPCKWVFVHGGRTGSFDQVRATPAGIQLSGWALDRSTTNPTYVWINVNGVGGAYLSDTPRPWFELIYPGYGNNHGYDVTIPKPPGTYQVCALNIDGTSQGCKNVTVPSNAAGSFDSATGVPGGIKLSGWSADLTTTNPSYIWVNVNGVGGPYTADATLPWFNALYPGAGLNHGFNTTIAKPPGTYQVCIYGTNSQALGCKTVTVPSNAAGSFDSATAVSGGINVKGWSVDLSTPNPSYIWVNVNGSGGPQVANVPLSWFDTMFPGEGPNHGFNATISKPPGTYQVCIYGTNSQALGCKTVTVG